MVRISKKPVKQETMDKIYQLLFEIIAKDKNKDQFLELFSEIFSPAEKIMIAKRVIIMYLLVKKVPQREIAQALKVSIGTISRYNILIEVKNSHIRDIVENLLLKEGVINLFDDIFHNLFIEPGIYQGHWQAYTDYLKRKQTRKILG